MSIMLYRIPSFLTDGATIGITAPARPVASELLEPALAWIKSCGWQAQVGATVGAKHYVFSAPADVRRRELQDMLDDPDLDAIWFARGGYGCVQLVEDLCWEGFRAHPKWLIGFSDTTTLLSAVLQQGYACLHATMPQQIYAHPEAHTDSLRTLKNQLRGVPSMYSWRGEVCGKLPNESGPLVGGNLSLIYNQMGPCQVDTRGAWIYLEEVAEYYYHLDRMLWGLRRSGFFSGSLGILAGGFSHLQDNEDDPWEGDVQALLEQHAQAVGLPLITHFPAGHQSPNWALPLGRKAHFESTSDMVKLHIH